MKKRELQYSITVPKYIIEKVEKDAKRYEKSRASMLAKIIVDHYEGKVTKT